MSNRIITQVFESSPIRQLATVETISTEALEVPNDLGEAAAGWVGEQEARPETATPQTGVLRIPAHEMYAQPKATQKLLEDASIDGASLSASVEPPAAQAAVALGEPMQTGSSPDGGYLTRRRPRG
jgi:HK97 family phage major capsid protein